MKTYYALIGTSKVSTYWMSFQADNHAHALEQAEDALKEVEGEEVLAVIHEGEMLYTA